MNTVSLPQSVVIHKQSHKIPFQDCWSASVLHKLPDPTLDHIHHQFEIAYQLIPWPKRPLTPPPTATIAPSGIFSVSLICCTADEEHSVPENYTYISFYSSLYVLMLLICAPDDANQLSEVSAALSTLPLVFTISHKSSNFKASYTRFFFTMQKSHPHIYANI